MNINNKGTDDNGREFTRPTSTFKTRGDKSRTFTMVMTSPNVYLYDDGTQWLENAATMFPTEPMPEGIEQRHGHFMPATFQVYGLYTPDGGWPLPFAFNIDRVVPVWETGPARLMVGVVDIHIGALHDEANYAKAEKIMKYERPAAPWRITWEMLRAIPLDTFTDEALKLAQVIVNVQPQVRPLNRELWVHRLHDGSPHVMNAHAVGSVPDADRNTRDMRGKKSRGPTTIKATEHKWNDPEMLAFAAKCYLEGMTRYETSRAFANIKQIWKPNTVGAQWKLATEQGLMTRNRRTNK
jgi:hypothetical protein